MSNLTTDQVLKMSSKTLVSELIKRAKEQSRATSQHKVQRAADLQTDVDLLAKQLNHRLDPNQTLAEKVAP